MTENRSGLRGPALMILLGLLASPAVAGEAPGTTRSGFDGWRQVGAPVWRFVPAGLEAGPDEDKGNLVLDIAYEDFRLTVDFWVEDGTNSGVFIRCKKPDVLDDINPVDCYEINIWDNHPNQDARSGSIVRHVKPVAHVNTLGRWNTFEIIADGPRIEVNLNGTLTAVLEEAEVASGYISLQYAGQGLLRFRNFSIDVL